MSLPKPLIPSFIDLTDFDYMPLYWQRLFDSDTWIECNAEEKVAALRAWCKAWHQIPAGSLPDDLQTLRELLDLHGDAEAVQGLLSKALYDWTLCSDGRLYHPFLAEKAASLFRVKCRLKARYIRRVEMESGLWNKLRKAVFARDEYTCVYCGSVDCSLEADHIFPLSRGGKSILENLATACRKCNRSKSDKTLEEWRGVGTA